MDIRILIVGTLPYNPSAASRAFDSYFHGWQRDALAQIFSNPHIPPKGHCGRLFQITDRQLLRRWFHPGTKVGRAFCYEELGEQKAELPRLTRRLYALGSRKYPLVYLLRGLLWRKRFWHTEELDSWLEEFQPQCVFLSFSDDYFIPKIALYAAEKFNIPILSSIGDDYYFNDRFSLSPLYHLYRLTYRRLIRRVFAHGGSAIYIGDKIRDKYNGSLGLNGRTVYLASDQERREFRPIASKNPKIRYFGNLRLGRNRTIAAIGEALGRIDPKYRVDVYSNEQDEGVLRVLKRCPIVRFHGAVPYEEVQRLTGESDILLLAEGFGKRDVDTVRYSLSTKTADAIASGAAVFACGHRETGAMEYCEKTGCVTVCTDLQQLEKSLRGLLFDPARQKAQYNAATHLLTHRHRLEHSTQVFRDTIKETIHGS
ncbi:MAG: hypothetical protein IJ001_13170 [Oscillospiraceae bacterium]|nr:hypothetical protein [Oscillospiraceae bacterium]MBQ8835858.1 hypothetical protein [Oscillospiraceae bacterium]